MHTNNETSQEGLAANPERTDHSNGIRIGRELIKATAPFAMENVARSWWHVGSIFSLLLVTLIAAGMAPWWPVRLLLSILGALFMVRAFITYHDYMHGSILRNSPVAWLLYRVYAAFALTPPRSWRESYNYHHLNVRIPFYRLPEAMAAIPELQSPETTSLAPRDIVDCFKASLWDEDLERMVSYREVRNLIQTRS